MEAGNNKSTDEAEATDAVKFVEFKEAVTRKIKILFSKDSDSAVWDEANEYDFTHRCRGTAVVFNMERLKGKNGEEEPREGSSIDAYRLKEAFKHLEFDVCYKENQTRQQVIELLKKESKRDHSNEDCFVCVILTHGSSYYQKADGWHIREDMIMAADTPILTSDLIKLFQDSECKSLKGKPKLFFIQACRGDTFDSGVNVHVVKEEVDAKPTNSVEFTPCPIYKDFLVMYATPPGFYAFRDPEKGSWFVQGLCKVLSSPGARTRSLHQLLTAVIKLVSLEYQAKSLLYLGNKQTPCFISMLVKDVYFRPKTRSLPL